MLETAPQVEAVAAEDEPRDRGRLSRNAKKIANYHVLLAGAMEDLEYHEDAAQRSDSGTDEPDRHVDTHNTERAPPAKPMRVFDLPPEFRMQPSCYIPGCTARFDRYRPDLKPALWVRTCLSHSRPHIAPGACVVCNDGPNSQIATWQNSDVSIMLCEGCATRLEAQIKHFVCLLLFIGFFLNRFILFNFFETFFLPQNRNSVVLALVLLLAKEHKWLKKAA